MTEENVFVGTNCQSFDPSKIQCDKEGNMPIHMLDKYCEENDTRYDILPVTIVQAVFDGITGTRLDRILASCNSVYLTWEGTFADTVNKLDTIYRRKGYIVTYRDETNMNWTKRYNSDDISDEAWSNPNNWEGWSFDTIIKDLAEALEEIFKNIGDYKDFLDTLVGFVNEFVIEVFNNIQSYPDLINIIKNSTIESLPVIIKDIFNNINNYPELKNLFDQYVQKWTIEVFNNIALYPGLSQFITNAINDRVEVVINSIFNNIDSYPKIKDLIINNTINKVIDIFKNIGQYPELVQAINNNVTERVNYIFTHLNEFPELVGILSDLICNCVKNIFNNINDYPALITCINNATNARVEYIFNNIDRFPILKNLIETKVEARVTYVFEHVNNFTTLLEVIKGNIEIIFDNINNHPALKTVIENKTTIVVEDILTNIDNYPTVKTAFTTFINTVINSRKGQINGIAELDADGKVPSNQLPSYVDDVLEGIYVDNTHFIEKTIDDAPVYYTPEKGKIYVDISEGTENSGKTYRWSGTNYVVISETIVIGEVEGTAYDGAKGAKLKIDLDNLNEVVVDNTKKITKNINDINTINKFCNGYNYTIIKYTFQFPDYYLDHSGRLSYFIDEFDNMRDGKLANQTNTVTIAHFEDPSVDHPTGNLRYIYVGKILMANNYKFYGIFADYYDETENNNDINIIKLYAIYGENKGVTGAGNNEHKFKLVIRPYEYYNKEEIDTKLSNLPSTDTVYTKAEVDKAIQDAIAALVPDGYELVIKKKTE